MADDERSNNHLPETSASTPNSNSGQQNATKAAKDRSCPFCGQAFTSSSLGRHLDLYIKPRNPKPPDGVHDVDEIRKIRGNITRRQPRTSGRVSVDPAREDGDGAHAIFVAKPATAQSHVAEDNSTVPPVNAKDNPEGMTFNHANWMATGVINNIPPRGPSRNNSNNNNNNNSSNERQSSGQTKRIDEMRRDNAGNKIQRPEYESESMWRLQQDAELGRAAEMALREVLGSLEAASKRVEPNRLFDDFDFYSLSFPGLCLSILPPPGTLFSPTPFASAESWTIGPPWLRQYEAATRFLNEKISARRKIEHVPDSVAFKHHSHLSGAWEHWQSMSEPDRSSAWNLEILRSFTRSRQQQQSLRTELEQSQQRTRHLEVEYDRLSRCQLPREYLVNPPNTIPITPNVMREVKSASYESGVEEVNYDAEALISKWRSTIKATTRRPQQTNSSNNTSPITTREPRQRDLGDEMVLNGSIWNVGGPMPREALSENSTGVTPVAYETPPNPGNIVEESPEDGSADAEGENVSEYGSYGQHALVKRMNGGLNANGKRPLTAGAIESGGRGTTKVYRAHD